MNNDSPDSKDEKQGLYARDADCEATYVPDETNEGPGKWHFSQKYNEGCFSYLVRANL
jgi:hypothetical protein